MKPDQPKATEAQAETGTEPKAWYEKGITTPREKNLVIVGLVFGLLILCLLCAIIMTIILSLLFPKKEYCYLPHCVKKAGSILRAMNMEANPCKDFFDFACGGWVEEYYVDEDSEIAIMGKLQNKIYKKFDRIIEQVKSSQNMYATASTDNKSEVAYAGIKAIRTYDACKNLSDDYHPENIIPLMKNFGRWPMADKDWSESNQPLLEQKLNVVVGDFGVAALFSISVEPEDDNPTRNIIKISEPQLRAIPENVWKAITKIAKDASSDVTMVDNDKKGVQDLMEKIEKELQEANGKEIPTNVTDLTQRLPKVKWKELFELLFGGTPGTDKMEFVLRNREVIEKVIDLALEDKRTLDNYFAVRILSEHQLLIINDIDPGTSTRPFSPSATVTFTELKGLCLQTVAQFLNFAMDHVFVYNQKKSVQEAGTLINYIEKIFMDLLEGYSWLGSSTRERLKTKLREMNNFIDYPAWLLEKAKVDAYYKDYEYKNNSNAVEAYANMVKFANRKMLATYKDDNDRNQWPTVYMLSVSTVNAFYIPQLNNFILPRAILNPPIYDEQNPKYLTYGSIGAIIGHEITHGFDSKGRHYDETGKKSKNIWTPDSTDNYDRLSQCFVEQYNQYIVDKTSNITVNGSQTLAENIADNGGLRQAYGAYHLWLKEINKGKKELSLPGLGKYSPEQMFFISYGQTWCISAGKKYLQGQVMTDEHTPNKYRVIGTLSNMKEFSKAFSCSDDSQMNPASKCVLW